MPKRALEDERQYVNILWLLIFDNVANALMRAANTRADVTRCRLCVCQTRGVRTRACVRALVFHLRRASVTSTPGHGPTYFVMQL